MRFLITGGCGFVGGVVSKYLMETGHEILVLDDGSSSVVEDLPGDVVIWESISGIDCRSIERFAPDAVLHFAARASVEAGERDPFTYVQNNVMEFSWFLNTLLRAGVRRVVHSGSYAVYGQPTVVPTPETCVPAPVSWYGWTKLMAEQLVVHLGKMGQLKYVAFRYGNAAGSAYGVVEFKNDRLIPNAVRAASTDGTVIVNGDDYPTPDGTAVRDYVHVLDLAEAHLLAATALVEDEVTNEIVNLGSGRGWSVREVLSAVGRVVRPVRVKVGCRRLGDPPILVADPAKAKRLYGWTAKRGLEDCVRDTLDAVCA